MNIIDLSAGTYVWYKGKLSQIIATQTESVCGLGQRVTLMLWDPEWDAAIPVDARQVEPKASDVFNLGDKVESIFGGFKGHVVAFEEETNRVVCCSQHQEACADRQRWAYRVSELKPLRKAELFEVGKKYRLHSTVPGVKAVKTVAMQFPQDGMIRLVDINCGTTVTIVPADATKEDLKQFGIREVDLIS